MIIEKGFACYETATDRIGLPPDATPYQFEHEVAHRHQFGSLWWLLLWHTAGRVVFIRNWVLLALEVDAALTARRVLKQRGEWTKEARVECLDGLLSYRKLMFKP